MAKECCGCENKKLDTLAKKQAKVLWIVLIINAVFFVAEFISGMIAKSVSLTGDSLDMLGDALTYGISIYVIGKSLSAKVKASQFKSSVMMITALFVLGRAITTLITQKTPTYEVMGVMSSLALIANLVCLWLLSKHKNDDINFSSVWLCSRNDIITNTSVIVASFLVYLTNTIWPDVIVGLGITYLVGKSSIKVWMDSKQTTVV
ncbi:cation transporter [Peredibacter sp. HCB2-198]|uniref:cation transporter n=1 Tax=Peredibacter sp. HCB2-198 TaxID=3383025 RepID=UPI0038B4F1A2